MHGPVTALLQAWRGGDPQALDSLLEALGPELHRIARACMSRERPGHTLQPTALVNDCCLKLLEGQPVTWQDRAHFLAIAARQMRRLLVDHARERLALKRGAGAPVELPTESPGGAPQPHVDILDLHRALEELALLDPRPAHVIELRYFGGLTEPEAAEVLGISVATLKRDWQIGRAWLANRLAPG